MKNEGNNFMESQMLDGLSRQILDLMISAAVAKPVIEEVQHMFSDIINSKNTSKSTEEERFWRCSVCGYSDNYKNYCVNCGEAREPFWVCPKCGQKNIKIHNFCGNCGTSRPSNEEAK